MQGQPPTSVANSGDIVLVPNSAGRGPIKTKYIIFAVVAIVILVACGVVAFLVTRKNNTSNNSAPDTTTSETAPIAPTTDVGKAWMRYATYITEGEEKEEGLGGEYSVYINYPIYEKLGATTTKRQAYLDNLRQALEQFYSAYLSSDDKTDSLTSAINTHIERFNFMIIRANNTKYTSEGIIQLIANMGPEQAYNSLIEPYTITYQDGELQRYNTLIIEMINEYINMYNTMANYGCLDNRSVCENNNEASGALNATSDNILQKQSEFSKIAYSSQNAYMESLWAIAKELEGEQ